MALASCSRGNNRRDPDLQVSTPYNRLPRESFWRHGLAVEPSGVPAGLYRKAWDISRSDKIATAGSCFAQHIGRSLKAKGFNLLDVEPAPSGLPEAERARYGYGIYSARYGNIYTTRQLLQLLQQAFDIWTPGDVIWEKDGGYVDALRPAIEPEPFGSRDEVLALRRFHLKNVRRMFEEMDVFIFTLGLTECWVDAETGAVFPIVPGAAGGRFDADKHVFCNLGFEQTYRDLAAFLDLLLEVRGGRGARVLLTVSPVPLAATALPRHVQVSTVYSKSVLRAVAGQVADERADVDYFPSYEIITSPWKGADFFNASDRRTVTEDGVAAAMAAFFSEHLGEAEEGMPPSARPDFAPASPSDDGLRDTVCEEELLAAFGPAS